MVALQYESNIKSVAIDALKSTAVLFGADDYLTKRTQIQSSMALNVTHAIDKVPSRADRSIARSVHHPTTILRRCRVASARDPARVRRVIVSNPWRSTERALAWFRPARRRASLGARRCAATNARRAERGGRRTPRRAALYHTIAP